MGGLMNIGGMDCGCNKQRREEALKRLLEDAAFIVDEATIKSYDGKYFSGREMEIGEPVIFVLGGKSGGYKAVHPNDLK